MLLQASQTEVLLVVHVFAPKRFHDLGGFRFENDAESGVVRICLAEVSDVIAIVDDFVNGEPLHAAIEKCAQRDESKMLGMAEDALNCLHFVLCFMCGLVALFRPCLKKPPDLPLYI